MSKTITMFVEPQGCRMEDKQTKFQLAPQGHMKAQGFEVTPEQQSLLIRADTVVELYQGLCRAVAMQEPIGPFVHALEGQLADHRPKRGGQKSIAKANKEETDGEAKAAQAQSDQEDS